MYFFQLNSNTCISVWLGQTIMSFMLIYLPKKTRRLESTHSFGVQARNLTNRSRLFLRSLATPSFTISTFFGRGGKTVPLYLVFICVDNCSKSDIFFMTYKKDLVDLFKMLI